MRADFVDNVVRQWNEERPELDVATIEVLERVLRIGLMTVNRAKAVCHRHGVTFWGFAVLTALLRSGPPYQLTPTSLHRSAMVTSGTVTKRVNELERKGLVERLPDPSDGRGVLVKLTRRGKRVMDVLVPEYLDMQRDMLAAIEPEERAQLGDLLRSLLLSLEPSAAPEKAVARLRRR